MPITRIYFPPTSAFDLHVLRGQPSVPLDTLLSVDDQDPDGSGGTFAEFRGDHAEVIIDFRPVFKAAETLGEFWGFGIRVDKSTGTVNVPAIVPPNTPPDPAPHNFIIEASVRQNGNGIPAATIPKAFLHVHVHERVEKIWMSPNRLSIHRPTATGDCNALYRFTVRAQFDDGTVGDITFTRHYEPSVGDAQFFTDDHWVRIPNGAGPGTVRTVTFVTTPEWNGRQAQGQIAVLEPWASQPDLPMAEWMSGHPGVLDGTVGPERVPNIVFVASGFIGDDFSAFEKNTDTVANELRTNRQLIPYKYLADSMNYWRLFIPASEAGVSVRCEVYSFVEDGKRFALPLPSPQPPPDTGPWTLNHLVYMAGLPVPADLNLVIDTSTQTSPASVEDFQKLKLTQLDFTKLVNKWSQTMRADPPHDLQAIDSRLLKQWVGLANRTFIDEVDNFPAIAIGEPPSTQEDFDETGLVDFHPLRGGFFNPFGVTHERSVFYKRVTAAPRGSGTSPLTLDGTSPGNEIGNLWAEDRDTFDFDNRQFAVTFCNMPIGFTSRFFGRSQRVFGVGLLVRPTMQPVGTGTNFPGLPVAKDANDPNRNALVLALPPAASTEMLAETWETIAHEVGHAFGLGDEYVLAKKTFADDEDHLNASANLTTAAAVLNPDQTVRVDQIKWNWHRILKAAVLTRGIENKLGGIFHAFVSKRSHVQFAEGEHVLLRQHELRQIIGRASVTSAVEFTLKSVADHNLDDPSDQENATIVLQAAPGVDLRPFGPGTVLFVPVPAPDSIRTNQRPYLTLVSPLAERMMAVIGGAMNGKACDVAKQIRDRRSLQTPALPTDILLQEIDTTALPGLVGVFFGGQEYACGILHPAGSCMMRVHRLTRTPHVAYAEFCPVCRYVLVDQIDPEQHSRIDRDYEKHYTL